MITLEINPFFRDYFPPLDYGQEQALKRSLQAGVTKEPLFYWINPETGKDELLEGHHRYKLAKQLRLEMEAEKKSFTTLKEAELFIIRHQTTRRSLDSFERERLVKRAVELQIEIEGKTKTEAVKAVAEQMGISESTTWRDIRPVNPVQLFRESQADLERRLAREKTKAVEAFKVQVAKEQLDEDTAIEKWQEIESEIDERFAEDIAKVDSLGEAASQAVEDNPGLRNNGKKRPAKKSVQDRAAKRNTMKKALGLIGKLQSEVLYFWQQTVGVIDTTVVDQALKRFAVEIEAEQEADEKAAQKRKFGK